ncbi:unnamed protein product [Clavelina lepadiformis]|uniref:Uncharacterized protein n=1 Tax=Clavelina lepadiformis TaxID=159417 RepID=A0ABP0GJK1_CLALP
MYKPNVQVDSSDVVENIAHKENESEDEMDVGCWREISDQLRDYCYQVLTLKFQHLDADFSTSETCITGDKFKRHCTKPLFWREQLNGKK